jgi:hypothetical protein
MAAAGGVFSMVIRGRADTETLRWIYDKFIGCVNSKPLVINNMPYLPYALHFVGLDWKQGDCKLAFKEICVSDVFITTEVDGEVGIHQLYNEKDFNEFLGKIRPMQEIQ